ncbi:MAG: hypothetical protein K0Q73_5642 [Paenibacillus sp.]|jgi:formylmethanofuran dehydrogenase subunit E|nr:hypothetical protein [Paenibacillus sp.]
MSNVVIMFRNPECEVCGQEVNKRFLKDWNDKQVCTTCINQINEQTSDEELFKYGTKVR